MHDSNLKYCKFLFYATLILILIPVIAITVSFFSMKNLINDLEIQANVECKKIEIDAGVIKGLDATIDPECKISIKFNTGVKDKIQS